MTAICKTVFIIFVMSLHKFIFRTEFAEKYDLANIFIRNKWAV